MRAAVGGRMRGARTRAMGTSSQEDGSPAPEAGSEGPLDSAEQPAAARLRGARPPLRPLRRATPGATDTRASRPSRRTSRAQGAGEIADQLVEHAGEDEMPRVRLTRRQIFGFAVFIASGRRLPLPGAAQSRAAWARRRTHRARRQMVGRRSASPSRWCRSAATWCSSAPSSPGPLADLLAGELPDHDGRARRRHAAVRRGGRGRVALTAWALRRSGMPPRLVACRMVAFMTLLYAVYAASLLIDGVGLATGASRAAARLRSRSYPRSPASCCSW